MNHMSKLLGLGVAALVLGYRRSPRSVTEWSARLADTGATLAVLPVAPSWGIFPVQRTMRMEAEDTICDGLMELTRGGAFPGSAVLLVAKHERVEGGHRIVTENVTYRKRLSGSIEYTHAAER